MSTNKKDLKAFVRYDGSERIVSGSLILRKKKPKVGKWKEIANSQCCTDVTLTTTVAATITAFVVKIYCSGTLVSTLASSQNSASVADLVVRLNATYPLLGVFSTTGGTNLTLAMSYEQKQALCSESKAITFTVTT